MVAAAIVVGCGLSVWASTYGAKLELGDFAKSLFYYLFMYGVGLRVGPSFINSLKGRRSQVHGSRVYIVRDRPGAGGPRRQDVRPSDGRRG
jgi:hypothetical protein